MFWYTYNVDNRNLVKSNESEDIQVLVNIGCGSDVTVKL